MSLKASILNYQSNLRAKIFRALNGSNKLTNVNLHSNQLRYDTSMDTVADTYEKKSEKKSWLKRFQKPSKNMFWAWIAYQAIKGTLTTSLIWIPLFWAWLH